MYEDDYDVIERTRKRKDEMKEFVTEQLEYYYSGSYDDDDGKIEEENKFIYPYGSDGYYELVPSKEGFVELYKHSHSHRHRSHAVSIKDDEIIDCKLIKKSVSVKDKATSIVETNIVAVLEFSCKASNVLNYAEYLAYAWASGKGMFTSMSVEDVQRELNRDAKLLHAEVMNHIAGQRERCIQGGINVEKMGKITLLGRIFGKNNSIYDDKIRGKEPV